MQNVLITGGAGFIGQNLVHAWRAARPADRLVVVDAMTYAANIRSLEPLIESRSIQFAKGDICDAALMRRLFDEHQFTRVAHLAAESHVDRSITDPEGFLQTNCRHVHLVSRAGPGAGPQYLTARASGTSRPTRFMARLAGPIPRLRNSRRIVRTRLTPPARLRATIWFARSSPPTACRR